MSYLLFYETLPDALARGWKTSEEPNAFTEWSCLALVDRWFVSEKMVECLNIRSGKRGEKLEKEDQGMEDNETLMKIE